MTKIRLVVGIISARKYAERRARCRRLWAHELAGRPGVRFRFFVGAGGPDRSFCEDAEPDAVALECPDDYDHLPCKTKCMIDWFLARYDFQHLFKCDDDTFVRVDRLLAYAPPGDYCGWRVSRDVPGSPDAASGGAGYMLSKRAARAASAALSGKHAGAEDDLVGRGLAAAGIRLHHDARFRWNAEPGQVPAPANDIITAHWVHNARAEEVVRGPWAPCAAPTPFPDDIVLKIGSRVIRWVIGPAHDRAFAERVLLPWAIPGATRLAGDARADFTVGVYLGPGEQAERVVESPGTRFLLHGGPECRHVRAEGCYQFAQQPRPDDDGWVRYGPMLGIRTPPICAPTKTRPCSVIEGSGRKWRLDRWEQLRGKVRDLDAYGPAYGRPLGGYHCVGPDPGVFSKCQALRDHAFNGAIERTAAPDHVSEKFTDPILCETVPIYSGCPNIDDYAVAGSYVRFEEAGSIDWRNWRAEYVRRRPAVLRQKELVRKHLNLLSYFVTLTERLDLLDEKRPLTLRTLGLA